MRGTIRIGRLLGIPIGVDITWFISLLWILGVLGLSVYPELLPREAAWVHWLLAVVTGFIFFACIILHELGHSVVARYYGIPVRSITLFILGGVAQITRDATRPLPELLMALAGPAVSILLGIVFFGLWFVTGRSSNAASTMLEYLWVMNIGVGIFNLAPAFPMDGGRVLRASLWGVTRNVGRATRIAVWVTRVLAVSLVAFGVVAALASPYLPFAFEPISGLWMAMIGFFLFTNANAGLRQLRLVEELRRHRVDDVMVRDLPVVLGSATVRDLLLEPLAGYGAGRDWLLVSDGVRFAGVVPRSAALAVPEREWDSRTAAGLMLPAGALHAVTPDATLADVLQVFQDHETRVAPVVRDGEVAGLVHEGQIARFVGR
jgi:Zn-dependent protease